MSRTLLKAMGLLALAASPAAANRLTFEVWPDANPQHAAFCSISLGGGRITLIAVQGLGLPDQTPLRWRASDREETALTAALQAFLSGTLDSVETYHARLPPPPFVTVGWMASFNGTMTTGLYIQKGLPLPQPLADFVGALGLEQACKLSATSGGPP